jgi:hypothetical protein
MVSSEGACAAYATYRAHEVEELIEKRKSKEATQSL